MARESEGMDHLGGEWITWVVMSMYESAESAVNFNGTTGESFSVKVGMY